MFEHFYKHLKITLEVEDIIYKHYICGDDSVESLIYYRLKEYEIIKYKDATYHVLTKLDKRIKNSYQGSFYSSDKQNRYKLLQSKINKLIKKCINTL